MTDARLRIISAIVFSLAGLGMALVLELASTGTPMWLPPMITGALGYAFGQAQTNGGLGKKG